MTDPVMLLSQVHGEGRVTFRALRAARFYTLAGVAEASIQQLSERAHLSVQTARRLKAGAEEMLDRGIGSADKDEPAKPAPSRGRTSRTPRFSTEQSGSVAAGQATMTLSSGISIEEALLLSGTWETTPEPFFAESTSLTVPGPRLPEMAAAAETAALLVRQPVAEKTPAATTTTPAETRIEERPEPRRIDRSPGETFWSFG